eukprot:70153-Rhodomonas_salina.4
MPKHALPPLQPASSAPPPALAFALCWPAAAHVPRVPLPLALPVQPQPVPLATLSAWWLHLQRAPSPPQGPLSLPAVSVPSLACPESRARDR